MGESWKEGEASVTFGIAKLKFILPAKPQRKATNVDPEHR
jgi:hypothetical protein